MKEPVIMWCPLHGLVTVTQWYGERPLCPQEYCSVAPVTREDALIRMRETLTRTRKEVEGLREKRKEAEDARRRASKLSIQRSGELLRLKRDTKDLLGACEKLVRIEALVEGDGSGTAEAIRRILQEETVKR